MNTKNKKEKGSIKWFILLVLGIIIASFYFNFDLQEAVEAEQTQSNFSYIKKNIIEFYNSYLKNTIDYLWNDIFIDLIWESFVENLKHIKAGELTTLEQANPDIPKNITPEIKID